MAKINALQSMYGCGTPATESAVAGSQTGTYLNQIRGPSTSFSMRHMMHTAVSDRYRDLPLVVYPFFRFRGIAA